MSDGTKNQSTVNSYHPEVASVGAALADAAHAGGLADAYYRSADDALQRLADEVERWKSASGLIDAAGDPDGVTPEAMRRYWEHVEAERDEARVELAEARSDCETMRERLQTYNQAAFHGATYARHVESAHSTLDRLGVPRLVEDEEDPDLGPITLSLAARIERSREGGERQ